MFHKFKKICALMKYMGILFFIAIFLVSAMAQAEDKLRYSCSAQISEAFGMERLEAFTKETGIEVELYITSSGSAVYRLMNGFSDIASTTQGLYYRQKESGYVEIPFCRDPLAVIANADNPVDNLTEDQVREILNKYFTSWKDVGGPDRPITIIIPGKNTAAYKNFERMTMRHREILYDYMTYQSTKVIEAVENFTWAISFISHGDIVRHEKIKAFKINGFLPNNEKYPYFQTFYYVTRGEPAGAAKKFIDFTQSEKGIAIMKANGMFPLK